MYPGRAHRTPLQIATLFNAFTALERGNEKTRQPPQEPACRLSPVYGIAIRGSKVYDTQAYGKHAINPGLIRAGANLFALIQHRARLIADKSAPTTAAFCNVSVRGSEVCGTMEYIMIIVAVTLNSLSGSDLAGEP